MGHELPPLARGRRVTPPRAREEAGATPAGAGTTPLARPVRPLLRSYPRWRGDDAASGWAHVSR